MSAANQDIDISIMFNKMFCYFLSVKQNGQAADRFLASAARHHRKDITVTLQDTEPEVAAFVNCVGPDCDTKAACAMASR